MFWIVVTVIALVNGQPLDKMHSNTTYPTVEACDAARPESIAKLQAELDVRYPGQFKVGDNSCVPVAEGQGG